MTRGRTLSLASMLALGLCAGACGDPLESGPAGACRAGGSEGKSQQAIQRAAESPTFLRLTEAELGSLLLVDSGRGEDVTRCSGVLLAPSWAATAAHCVANSPREIAVSGATGACTGVSEVVVHETADVALLALDPELAGATPFALAGRPEAFVGEKAQLAGYGVDEEGTSGRLGFAVSEITRATPEMLVVSGTSSGACFGDSGAPLLSRGASGQITVLGTLSRGSASCSGFDEFVRSDGIARLTAGRFPPPEVAEPLACAEVGPSGRCYGSAALYCSDQHLVSESCSERKRCGWDTARGRYGCTSSDPCTGVGDLGSCAGDTLLECREGELVQTSCAAMGSICLLDGQTGRAQCAGHVTL